MHNNWDLQMTAAAIQSYGTRGVSAMHMACPGLPVISAVRSVCPSDRLLDPASGDLCMLGSYKRTCKLIQQSQKD